MLPILTLNPTATEKTAKEVDPRVMRTREAIENAFLACLQETTLHQLTVGDITQRAGINRATFYAHYFDKYALFSHIVRKTFLQTLQEQLPTAELGPFTEEKLRALIHAVYHYFIYLNSQCPPADRQLRPVAETAVQEVLYACLHHWLAQETSLPNSELAATYISWGIFGVGLNWVGSHSSQSIDEATAEILALVQNTLASSPKKC